MVHTNIKYQTLSTNISIAYLDEGEGDTSLLFIHGLANYLWVWKWNIQELKKKYRCLAIDLPGNGLSSRGNFDFTFPFWEQCILEFIAKQKLKKVILVGHSMGGQIASYLCIRNPLLCTQLILIAPAGFEYFTPHEANLLRSAITLGNFFNMDEVHISQSIRNSFFITTNTTQLIINELNAIIKKNDRIQYRRMLELCMDNMLNTQIYHQLKTITARTLVLFGEEDMLIPNKFLHPGSTASLAKKATQQIPNVQLILYKKAGHFVQIEKYNEVNKDILLFLQHPIN